MVLRAKGAADDAMRSISRYAASHGSGGKARARWRSKKRPLGSDHDFFRRSQKKECSFLKKRTKKLLLLERRAVSTGKQKFFAELASR